MNEFGAGRGSDTKGAGCPDSRPTTSRYDWMKVAADNERMRAVLEGAAVTFEDERVGYVEIQVDREAWLHWKDAPCYSIQPAVSYGHDERTPSQVSHDALPDHRPVGEGRGRRG